MKVSSAIMKETNAYLALMGKTPKRIPFFEVISNPDYIQLITGMDPWQTPRSAMLKFLKMHPIDLPVECPVPSDDTPIPKPDNTSVDENGHPVARWGMQTTAHWSWGEKFKTIESVLAFDPLANADMRQFNVFWNLDYSLDDETFRAKYFNAASPANPEIRDIGLLGFYNTLFMWPIEMFGWELSLELFGAYPEEAKRIIDGFATFTRKAVKAIAKAPEHINMVWLHDDICMTSGPVCSPQWLRDTIYPHYEEFFNIIKPTGKRIVFISDGNIDKVFEDVAACGADGFITEPYTDFAAIARKYPGHVLAGQGDNRILSGGNATEIKGMVDRMVDTARECGGYMMRVGNGIPWNVPPQNVKLYFDYSREKACR